MKKAKKEGGEGEKGEREGKGGSAGRNEAAEAERRGEGRWGGAAQRRGACARLETHTREVTWTVATGRHTHQTSQTERELRTHTHTLITDSATGGKQTHISRHGRTRTHTRRIGLSNRLQPPRTPSLSHLHAILLPHSQAGRPCATHGTVCDAAGCRGAWRWRRLLPTAAPLPPQRLRAAAAPLLARLLIVAPARPPAPRGAALAPAQHGTAAGLQA